MEEVIKICENLGLTIKQFNSDAKNLKNKLKITFDIMKNNNKIIFYILDLEIIKYFIDKSYVDNNNNNICLMIFNLNGDDDGISSAIFNYNNNNNIQDLKKQLTFISKNKMDYECCICFEKKKCIKCYDCISVICIDCLNKMYNTNKIPTCPCCREKWFL